MLWQKEGSRFYQIFLQQYLLSHEILLQRPSYYFYLNNGTIKIELLKEGDCVKFNVEILKIAAKISDNDEFFNIYTKHAEIKKDTKKESKNKSYFSNRNYHKNSCILNKKTGQFKSEDYFCEKLRSKINEGYSFNYAMSLQGIS